MDEAVGGAQIHTSRVNDGAVLLDVRGEIDMAVADRLHDALVDVATRVRPGQIVVDLLHVTFIDSTGLGALARGRNAAYRTGIGFAVRHPSAFVARQMRQTDLYDTLVMDRSRLAGAVRHRCRVVDRRGPSACRYGVRRSCHRSGRRRRSAAHSPISR
jgi:anti-sigma B factor antagonist